MVEFARSVYSYCTMKTLTLLLLLGAPALAVAAPPPSHCKASETTYFNCTLKGGTKVVSLCGKDMEGAGSYLQYRYGSPGRGTELVYPPSRTSAASAQAFFFNRGNPNDSSRTEYGVWFENANTYYELKHVSYLGAAGEKTGAESEILMWAGVPSGAPRPLVCKQSKGGANLVEAGALIEAMAPKGHAWRMSPLDVHYKQRERKAAEEAALQESEE